MKRIFFITGTDTGVGKTLLTGLLLAFLRNEGHQALAMKPFCSGGRRDARLLHALQKECLTLNDVNPFYFDKPVAPGTLREVRAVPLRAVLRRIELIGRRCDYLLVEGIGGILAPLGKNYDVRDLIKALDCKTIVVGANRLGTINHTRLTIEALHAVGIKKLAIVLMGSHRPDFSGKTNAEAITKRVRQVPVIMLPVLGPGSLWPIENKK